MSQHPEVLWAQRSSTTDADKNYVYLTIGMPDVPKDKLKLNITSTGVEASGHSTTKNIDYATKLELFGEIDPDKTKKNHTDRDLELVQNTKELKEEYWPRLLKEKGKVHFLRTDFDKWVDEDEQEGNPDDEDFMSKMGGMGGAGGPGGFEGIDFSKLGAGPMGGDGDEEAEEEGSDDDEDMPELEGEDESKAGASSSKAEPSSSKIQEVE